MKFKALLFDAGDVLYHRPRRGKGLAAFLAQHGLSSTTPDGQRLADLKRRAHAGEITKEAYQNAVLELHGVFLPALKLQGCSIMDEEQRDIEFFEGVPETLKRLKAAGLRLGVVTNTYDATADKLEWFRRVGIDSVWDGFATSCELKACKPDARIYLAALNPLGVQSKEAAFVGHAPVELQGAKALGMTTIAFNRDAESVTADHVISSFTELLPLVGV